MSGKFIYARQDTIALPVVAAPLAGSALGARIGAGAAKLVGETDSTEDFAAVVVAAVCELRRARSSVRCPPPIVEWHSIVLATQTLLTARLLVSLEIG